MAVCGSMAIELIPAIRAGRSQFRVDTYFGFRHDLLSLVYSEEILVGLNMREADNRKATNPSFNPKQLWLTPKRLIVLKNFFAGLSMCD